MKKIKISLSLLLALLSLTLSSANFYWIGGTGNWNDGSHWSTSSGGPQAGSFPTSADNVFFDVNSFTASSQTVVINVAAACNNMDWTGTSFNPTINGGGASLDIYGSLTLASGLTWNYTGATYFRATTTGKTITSNGASIGYTGGYIFFDGVGGGWTLQDNFTCNSIIYLTNGTLNSNNKTITTTRLDCASYASSGRTLTLGTSTVTINFGGGSFDGTGTNLTVNAGSSTIIFSVGNGYFYGGGHIYGTVNYTDAAATGITSLSSSGIVNKVICSGGGTMQGNGGVYLSLDVSKAAMIYGNNTYGKVVLHDNSTIGVNGAINTIDTLIFSAGKTYTFWNGVTQTINKYFSAIGSCSAPIVVNSNVVGTAASISCTPTTTLNLDYVRLKDLTAIGGNSFNANHAIDLGNNTGWNLTAPTSQNLYWVGGSGNWDDVAHWSTSSGGTSGTCIPSGVDNVFFDANSFSSGSNAVNVNTAAFCNNMDWTGAGFSPILNGSSPLNIYGSLTFISSMLNNFTGILYFKSTTSGNTITSAGKSFTNAVHFDGPNSDWTLQDAFTLTGTNGDLYLDNGYLVTNDKTLSINTLQSNNTNIRGLYLMNSTINVAAVTTGTYPWYMTGANSSVDGGTSTINLTGAGVASFYGGSGTANIYYDVNFMDATPTTLSYIYYGTSYHNVTFNARGYITNLATTFSKLSCTKDIQIDGSGGVFSKAVLSDNGTFNSANTFDTLVITGSKTYSLTPSYMQNIGMITVNSSCNGMALIKSSNGGTQATINANAGNITTSYLLLQDINAIGAAFTATNSFDLGNNSGWTITNPTSRNLYWRGGAGNWTDVNHWSLTSGGAGGACVPTAADNVFFNGSSFTAGSKVVTMNATGYCKSMSWTGAGFTPTLTGAADLNIYGSLTFITAMNMSASGKIYFRGPLTGNTITSSGRTFTSEVHVAGTGNWTLQDAFNQTSGGLYLDQGTLNTNGKSVTIPFFVSATTLTKQLILGSSVVNVTGIGPASYVWNASGTNSSILPGTSHVKVATNTALLFGGPGGANFYDITFQGASSDAQIQAPMSAHNLIFTGRGYMEGGTFNKIAFNYNGPTLNYIHAITTTDSLTYASGSQNYMYTKITVNKYFKADGTAGSLTKFVPAGGTYTLSVPACTVCQNYIDIASCFATGGASFYADNSTNSGGNTGWNFAPCPSNTISVGPISGAVNTCTNTTNTYSIPSIYGATYTWTVPAGCTITSGQGTNSIQMTAGGAGTVSVTAFACGQTNSATKTITVNPIPTISGVNVTSSTCSHKDGSATVTVSSGTSPYTYQWSSGATTAVADSLYSGQYSLNISDTYGCATSTLVTVSSSNGPSLNLNSTTNVTCNGGNTGSLSVTATGGTAPYTYAWTSGATTGTVNNLIAGTYVLTVTDNTGCQVTGSYVVSQPSAISVQINTTPSPCSGTSGSATAVVSGGTGSYTYQWSANAASQTTATASSLAAGLYSVVVTDGSGCTKNASAIVNTNTNGASITLDNIVAGTCGTNGPGAINITAFGGATPYTFNWSNGASTEDLSFATPGTYSLGVIDANGCMTYTSFVVPNANPNYQPQICVVTFDTTTMSNLVAWEKTGAVGIEKYNIYCEIGSFNNYQLVGSVPAGNLSEFVHPGANPDVKSWKYKISAVDSCGNETAQSSFHKTIHLQISQGSGGAQNLSWDNYDGFNYGGFEVWRHTPTTNWVQLTSIAYCGSQFCTNTYTDFTPVPGDTNRYAILVSTPATCVTTARLGNNGAQGAIVKSRSNVKNNRANNPTTEISNPKTINKYSVYPNPATTEITISLNKDCSNCVFEIMNALGQTIRSEKLTAYETKMNIAALPNGVYYVKVKSDKYAQYTQKLVVQH